MNNENIYITLKEPYMNRTEALVEFDTNARFGMTNAAQRDYRSDSPTDNHLF